MALVALENFKEKRADFVAKAHSSKFASINDFIATGSVLEEDQGCIRSEKSWSAECTHQCDFCTTLKHISHKRGGKLRPTIDDLEGEEFTVSEVADTRSTRKAISMAYLVQGALEEHFSITNTILWAARCGGSLMVVHVPAEHVGWEGMDEVVVENMWEQLTALAKLRFTYPAIFNEGSVSFSGERFGLQKPSTSEFYHRS